MSEVASLAKNLARNSGYPVFPCSAEKKMPSWSKADGGKGFHDASTDPSEIERLFRHPRAELIGLRTGETSGISVLDVDVKHDEARAWWIAHERRLPATRTYRTRSGGLHLYFRHAAGVRNSEGNPIKGIDSRGEGGYVIYWFASGLECLDHAPPAPWPAWLTTFFWPPPKPPIQSSRRHDNLSDTDVERVIERAIKRVREAGDGQRHFRLRSSGRLLGGIQSRAGFSDNEACRWLLEVAGLQDERKALKTVEWGLEKGRMKPLDLRGRA